MRQRFFEKKSSFSEDIEKVGGLITAREKTIYNCEFKRSARGISTLAASKTKTGKKENMSDNEIIISGQNLELTEALKASVTNKMQKLFVHDERIIRLRVELAYQPNKHHHNEFTAKGRLEIQGPDMVVSVASDDMYKSIDELLVKLARKIRRRHRLERIKRKSETPAKLSKSA